jgi:hypothetical protein
MPTVEKGNGFMKVISIWVVVPIKRSDAAREPSPLEDNQAATPTAEETEAVKKTLVEGAKHRAFPEQFGVSTLSRN